MKTLVLAIAISILTIASVSDARPHDVSRGDSGLPTLKGQKASELIEILVQVGYSEPSCPDNCYKRGELDVRCKSPSGTKSDVSTGCSIFPLGKSAPEVTLNKEKSTRMMNLLDSAHATEESINPCSMGSCHQNGSISVECQYPAGKNPEKEFSCAISAVPKKSAAPAARVPLDRDSGNR